MALTPCHSMTLLPMSRVVSAYRRLGDESETNSDLEQYYTDTDHPEDDAFGGPERRRQIEKKLLRKLDLRVGFLVLVHVMNYVASFGFFILLLGNLPGSRWTGTMWRECAPHYSCDHTKCFGKGCKTERSGRGSENDGRAIQYAGQHPLRRLRVNTDTIVRSSSLIVNRIDFRGSSEIYSSTKSGGHLYTFLFASFYGESFLSVPVSILFAVGRVLR